MSEFGNTKGDKRNPWVAVLFDNPIATINMLMIVAGGGAVWATNESRVAAVEKYVTNIEVGYKSANSDLKAIVYEIRNKAEVSAGMNNTKAEQLTAQISALSVKLSSIETSLQFLVNAQRRRPND